MGRRVCLTCLLIVGLWSCDRAGERPINPFSPAGGISVGAAGSVTLPGDGGGGAGGAGAGGTGGDGGDGGDGGAGGQIEGSACELGNGCDACISCALVSDCSTEQAECLGDGLCNAALQCLLDCGVSSGYDPATYDLCRADCAVNNIGYADAQLFIGCACRLSCPNDCAVEGIVDCTAELL